MAKAEIIPQANELCRISKGTRITGVMTSSADIRIDGVFEGTVYTKGKLVIGEAAHVKGKVFCQNCDLWGHAEGEMYIEDIINFKAKPKRSTTSSSTRQQTSKALISPLSPLLPSPPRNNPLAVHACTSRHFTQDSRNLRHTHFRESCIFPVISVHNPFSHGAIIAYLER